ncbi:hypothetical protein [Kitasatospora sp. NPDC008115]|uniref:hypothetical protein n=1 Tax=Kitasatospora sp. NPDC008115 TaxID=3364022 RepID=UPI0036F0007A
MRRTSYWALTQDRLSGFAAEAGFEAAEWLPPAVIGFFQPLLLASVARPAR